MASQVGMLACPNHLLCPLLGILLPLPPPQTLLTFVIVLLNGLNIFNRVGTFGSYESLGVHSGDVPIAGMATFLKLTSQKLAWVVPPGPAGADVATVKSKCVLACKEL